MLLDNNKDKVAALFAGDIPCGYRICCGDCSKEWDDTTDNVTASYCHYCQVENVYRSWYSW